MSLLTRMYYPVCRSRTGHAIVRAAVGGVRRVGGLHNPHLPFDALSLDYPAYAGLATLWSRIHWSPGDGMMPQDELLAIYRLAVEWPVEGDIIELGAWIGLTTSYLATACRVRGSGKVWAVDTFAGTMEGDRRYPGVEHHGGTTLPEFHRRVDGAGVTDLVETLPGLTREMAGVYPGQPARLLLIDADHSYAGVRDDFNRWLPHVAPGGVVVFHDYRFPDVSRFINDEVLYDSRVAFSPGIIRPNVVAVTKHPADHPTDISTA